MNETITASRALVKAVCHALAEKKAEDLRVLDVSEHSSITNFLVLASGTSAPHLRALRIAADQALSPEPGSPHVRMETAEESGWTVLDAFDVMVHLFTPEQRDRYSLEHLWKDADELQVSDLFGPVKARLPRVAKTSRPRTAAAPKKAKAAPKPAPKTAATKVPAKKAASRRKSKG